METLTPPSWLYVSVILTMVRIWHQPYRQRPSEVVDSNRPVMVDHGCTQSHFGPGVSPLCGGIFDFTLLFEDTILTLLPTACFLLLAPWRIWRLSRATTLIRLSPLYYVKLVAALVLVAANAISIAELGIPVNMHRWNSGAATSAAVLDLVSSMVVVVLSCLEHFRSIKPSLLLCSFLSATFLLEVARVRSSWLQEGEISSRTAFITASLAAKVLVLAAESVEKRSLLRIPEKDLSGESTGGPFNRALFLWLNGLLKVGWEATLKPDDLPAVDVALGVETTFRRLDKSWACADQRKSSALLLTVVKTFKREIFAVVIPRLCLVGLSIAQPFMIGQTVTFLHDKSETSNDRGYGLLGAFALVFILTAVTTALYQHLGYRVMTMLRGSLIAALYQHMMNLPVESVSESAAMGLMSSDAEAFAEYFQATITDTWADLLQVAVAIYLIARIVGAIVVAPVIVAILFTWLSFRVGDSIAARQRKWLQSTQKRVNYTTAVMSRIRDAKILGLSEYLTAAVSDLRGKELDISKAFRRVSTIKTCLVNMPMFLGQFAVFAAYGIAAHIRGTGELSIAETVTTLSLINLLLTPLRNLLYAIPDTYSSLSCLRSIQEFLVQDKRVDRRLLPPFSYERPEQGFGGSEVELRQVYGLDGEFALSMTNAVFGEGAEALTQNAESSGNTGLTLITPPAGQGSLTIITGPVGCGKSTVLKAILEESPYLHGTITLSSPEVAYCAQDPWIVNATVRENIIGLSTENAFDQQWYSTVIRACALDIDFANLSQGDSTVTGSRGAKFSGGQKQRIALARALYARKQTVLLDGILSGLDKATRSTVFRNVCGRSGLLRRLGCTVVMTASYMSSQQLSAADHILLLGKSGEVLEEGTYEDMVKSGSPITNYSHEPLPTAEGSSPSIEEEVTAAEPRQEESELLHTPDLAVWKFYFGAMGWTKIALLGIFLSIEGGFGAFRYVWLTWWSASPDAASGSRLGYWLGIYSLYGALEIIGLALGTFYTWVVIVPAASRKLHSLLLTTTMGAPASFLSNTETGTLINRFSQDIRQVDIVLPRGFISTGFQLFGTVAQAAVAIAALPYLAPAIPFVVLVLVLIQRFYLRTSRQLRLLALEMKAPVFTHFIESLHGLITIRAFGWNESYLSRAFALLDTAQRPYYLLLSIQRWLTLVLNLVVAGMVILLVGLSIALRDLVKPELLGVALVMMTGLGQMIADLIQAWTLLETSLGAVSRIKAFAEKTPREEAGGMVVPHSAWPSWGEISVREFSARHDAAGGLVLRDVQLTVSAGQKFGICGRTGSGKSSLLMSLLRMVEVQSGRILIDGVDIAEVSPAMLRTRINCLTQEPFIVPDTTVRQNAAPLAQSSDAEIIRALQTVGVWDVLTARLGSGVNPLDAKLEDHFLSHGQVQLFVLARAMLRKNMMLLLDEPSSSLDTETHERVQSIIYSHFEDCTILMVAHRLDSLLSFDRVIVLSDGEVVEYGEPKVLLSDEDSEFAKLYGGSREQKE